MLHLNLNCNTHPRVWVLRHEAHSFHSTIHRPPLHAVPLHLTTVSGPDEAPHIRTWLWEDQDPAVQLQWHTALPRRTVKLTLPPWVLVAYLQDQTRRGLFISKGSPTMPPSGRAEARVDLSSSSTTPCPSGYLMVASFWAMTRRMFWQLRPTSGWWREWWPEDWSDG